MKKTSLLFFIFFGFSLFSQKNSFDGGLLRKDKSISPYFLEINIDSNYHVYGFAITEGSKKIRSAIEGKFDPKNNFIFYTELSVNSNKDECPIYVQARVSHLIEDIYVIAGLYQSQDSNRCGNGHINVINRNFKFNLYNKTISPVENDSVNQLILSKTMTKNVEQEKKFINVTAADNTEIHLSQPYFVVKIYDQLKIDRDKVRIILNGKIVSELELTAEFKGFNLKANKGVNILEFEAINEGSIPMNTSKLEIVSRDNSNFFTNLLYKSQKATYTIIYD